eukprot:IDg5414t1
MQKIYERPLDARFRERRRTEDQVSSYYWGFPMLVGP